MELKTLKNRKIIFFAVLVISFIAIYVFNALTPIMSDDLAYYSVVRNANSFWDLIIQEYEHHMAHSGRNVSHFILRIFLSSGKGIFNFFNSIMYMILSLEIYINASKRQKYDFGLFIIIQILLWTVVVRFDETILWMDGACNYLWTTSIILGFLTVYRYLIKNHENIEGKPKYVQALIAIGILILGILGGWSNENNSGGCFLLVVCFLILSWKEIEKKAWAFAGPIGVLIGMVLMLSSPANWDRKEMESVGENYSGIVKLISHFVKATSTIRRLFGIIIVLYVILFVILYIRKTTLKEVKTVLVWLICAFATGYVLIFISEPVDRAYFGMGIFLIVGLCDSISMVLADSENIYIKWAYDVVVIIGSLWLISTWIIDSPDLARIKREFNEREAIAQAQLDKGVDTLYLPMIREEFKNKYTNVYNVELSEDPGYWTNIYYENYYYVEKVIGIDRQTWDSEYADKY